MAVDSFLLTPTFGSLAQIVIASAPLLALLCYFLYLAHERPSEPCYAEFLTEDEISTACHLIPLKQMVIVCLVLGFMWSTLVSYLSVYVPRRRALIERYLENGKRINGNVHYNSEKTSSCSCCHLSHYGHVVYPHPHYDKLPVYIRRQVRVVERYTREGTTLLYLEDLSFSAQPKQDLEIDREIFRLNEARMKTFRWFSWLQLAFCYIAPIYILGVLYDLDEAGIYDFQPDYDTKNATFIFALVAGALTPITAYMISAIAWSRHEKWMTWEHKILEEGDSGGSYDDGDCEKVAYNPPVPRKSSRHT
jgi:hypothetical protein